MHLNSVFSLALLLFTWSVSAQQCSSTVPCKQGCCSKFGNCGFGADYCGSGCQGTCNAKSECDPGWGAQYSNAETCPLNVCCSKYGFCGTSSDFCGANTRVPSPSCSGTSAQNRTIGYYEGWSPTRPCGVFYPEQLPVTAYTHINFAFAFIDPVTFAVAPMSGDQVPLYKRTTALKDTNPGLQVWISIGGWSMNDPDQPTAKTFSQLAASAANRQKFVSSLISFMQTYGFDGVDIDWEYPVAPERSGSAADFTNFPLLLNSIRQGFASAGGTYGLSVTLPASYWYLRNFDIVTLEKYVDWFNMLTYDLHGTWDASDPYVGNVIGAHTNLTEIDAAMNLLWRNNINPSQVNLGLGFYGRSFTLQNPSCATAGCPFSGGGNAGPCTQTAGYLSYAEIVNVLKNGATVTTDTTAAVKIATYGSNQWVSYDDASTLKQKIQYANNNCLGGTLVWALDQDTPQGNQSAALSSSTGQQAISKSQSSLQRIDPLSVCTWTPCGNYQPSRCPIGQTPVYDDAFACPPNGRTIGDTQLFCCPKNDQPTCRATPGFIFCGKGACTNDEVQIGTTSNLCDFRGNYRAFCCTKNAATAAIGQCGWVGDLQAPECMANGGAVPCPGDRPNLIATSRIGDGRVACSVGYQSYCCSNPSPYLGCNWYTGANGKGQQSSIESSYFGLRVCSGSCPANKVLIASSYDGCLAGSKVLCCNPPASQNDPAFKTWTNNLNAFKADHTCPLREITDVSGDVPPPDDGGLTRRDLKSTDIADISKRDLSSAGGLNWIRLVSQVAQGQSYRSNQFSLQYDAIIGEDTGFYMNDLLNAFEAAPSASAEQIALERLCEYANALSAQEQLYYTNSELCVFPGLGEANHKREIPKKFLKALEKLSSWNQTVVKRIFQSNNGVTTPQGTTMPQTGQILNAVINGQVQLLYTRQVEYRIDPYAMIFEIAYDVHNMPNLQMSPYDQMAIFHVHVNRIVTDSNTGNLYAEVTYVHVFHSRNVYNYATGHPGPAVWAGNHGYGRNARDAGQPYQRAVVNDCNYAMTNEVWYPGRTVPNPPQAGSGADVVYRWGNTLYQNGVFMPLARDANGNGQGPFSLWNPNDGPGRWNFPANGAPAQRWVPGGGTGVNMDPNNGGIFPANPTGDNQP